MIGSPVPGQPHQPTLELGRQRATALFPADECSLVAADKYRVFGELLSQPSRLAPNAAVDSTIGQLVASGLSTSATVLCTNLLRSASK